LKPNGAAAWATAFSYCAQAAEKSSQQEEGFAWYNLNTSSPSPGVPHCIVVGSQLKNPI